MMDHKRELRLNLRRLAALAQAVRDEWLDPKNDQAEMLKGWRAMWWLGNYLRSGEAWFNEWRGSNLWETCPEDARFLLEEGSKDDES